MWCTNRLKYACEVECSMTDIQLKWNSGVQVHKDNIWRDCWGMRCLWLHLREINQHGALPDGPSCCNCSPSPAASSTQPHTCTHTLPFKLRHSHNLPCSGFRPQKIWSLKKLVSLYIKSDVLQFWNIAQWDFHLRHNTITAVFANPPSLRISSINWNS